MKIPMNPNHLRPLLRWGSIGCWGGALLVIVWAVWPEAETTPSSNRPARLVVPAAVVDPVVESVAWNRSLQGSARNRVASNPKPKRNAVPNQPVVSKPTMKSLGVRLIGTITEDQQRIAIASDRSGRLVFHAEGEELQLQPSGIRVEKISNNQIRVRYQNRTHSISVGNELTLASSSVSNTMPRNKLPQDPITPSSLSQETVTIESVIVESSESASLSKTKSPANDADWFDEDEDHSERTIIDVDEFPEMDLDAELDMLNGF